jgi:Flp pilus assembly protein TadG
MVVIAIAIELTVVVPIILVVVMLGVSTSEAMVILQSAQRGVADAVVAGFDVARKLILDVGR